MRPGRKPREFVVVSVPVKTYERLSMAAHRHGEQVPTYLDGLINAWLDEEQGRN